MGRGQRGWAQSATLASDYEVAAASVHFDALPPAGTVLCKMVMRHGVRAPVSRAHLTPRLQVSTHAHARGLTCARASCAQAKRQVRRMLKTAGFLTIRLCRSRIGDLTLDDLRLRAGEWCVVPPGPALAGLYRAASQAEQDAAAFDSESGQWVHMGERVGAD